MNPSPTAEATFVEWVDDPFTPDLLNFAKAETFTRLAEHAVLELDDGRFGLFHGGAYGIDLLLDADGNAVVRVRDRWRRVKRLLWHVHPVVTGPSDADRRVLQVLGQAESHLWEINGESEGVAFGPTKPSSDDVKIKPHPEA